MQYNNENSPVKYGKVYNFDGLVGEIITEDNRYYFTIDNILDNQIINNDDWVRFNSKGENIFPEAYYISKIKIYRSK